MQKGLQREKKRGAHRQVEKATQKMWCEKTSQQRDELRGCRKKKERERKWKTEGNR